VRDLGQLVVLVRTEAGQSHARLKRTSLVTRATSITIIAATVFALVFSLRSAVIEGLGQTTDWVPLVESVINDLVFAAIAVFFLYALPGRMARERLLAQLHRLRSLAHIVDMHQLTKDPERLLSAPTDTLSSPSRTMTSPDLGRYLDYCSELLSITSKIAALLVQYFDDAVVLGAVNEIETLTTGLSGKIWQKITILDRASTPSRARPTPV
jgi:hypothetical protein